LDHPFNIRKQKLLTEIFYRFGKGGLVRHSRALKVSDAAKNRHPQPHPSVRKLQGSSIAVKRLNWQCMNRFHLKIPRQKNHTGLVCTGSPVGSI